MKILLLYLIFHEVEINLSLEVKVGKEVFKVKREELKNILIQSGKYECYERSYWIF